MSETFRLWNEYEDMVWLLLAFLHGERDSNWKLHLETFRAMLPYDRAFYHLNYFRWGAAYLINMTQYFSEPYGVSIDNVKQYSIIFAHQCMYPLYVILYVPSLIFKRLEFVLGKVLFT
jgi:hypothetical protein